MWWKIRNFVKNYIPLIIIHPANWSYEYNNNSMPDEMDHLKNTNNISNNSRGGRMTR